MHGFLEGGLPVGSVAQFAQHQGQVHPGVRVLGVQVDAGLEVVEGRTVLAVLHAGQTEVVQSDPLDGVEQEGFLETGHSSHLSTLLLVTHANVVVQFRTVGVDGQALSVEFQGSLVVQVVLADRAGGQEGLGLGRRESFRQQLEGQGMVPLSEVQQPQSLVHFGTVLLQPTVFQGLDGFVHLVELAVHLAHLQSHLHIGTYTPGEREGVNSLGLLIQIHLTECLDVVPLPTIMGVPETSHVVQTHPVLLQQIHVLEEFYGQLSPVAILLEYRLHLFK